MSHTVELSFDKIRRQVATTKAEDYVHSTNDYRTSDKKLNLVKAVSRRWGKSEPLSNTMVPKSLNHKQDLTPFSHV